MLNTYESARNALAAFGRTDAKMPTKVTAALAHADAVAAFMSDTQHSGLAAAIGAALKAGTDPALDPDVAAATTREVWATMPVRNSLHTRWQNETIAAIVGNVDALLDALQPAFTRSAKHIEEAHAVLGDIDLDADHKKIMRAGGDALAAWSSAVEGTRTLATIMAAWNALAPFAGITDTYKPAALVAWDPAAWVSIHHSARHQVVGSTAWDAVRNGFTLRLADRKTLHEFSAAVAEAEQKAAQKAADEKNKRFPSNR